MRFEEVTATHIDIWSGSLNHITQHIQNDAEDVRVDTTEDVGDLGHRRLRDRLENGSNDADGREQRMRFKRLRGRICVVGARGILI